MLHRASILVFFWLSMLAESHADSARGVSKLEGAKAVVSAVQVERGAKLRRSMFRVEWRAKTEVPDDALQYVEDLVGRSAIRTLAPGELVRVSDVTPGAVAPRQAEEPREEVTLVFGLHEASARVPAGTTVRVRWTPRSGPVKKGALPHVTLFESVPLVAVQFLPDSKVRMVLALRRDQVQQFRIALQNGVVSLQSRQRS
jgi:hypothetical protein